jgi:hypothetical protein
MPGVLWVTISRRAFLLMTFGFEPVADWQDQFGEWNVAVITNDGIPSDPNTDDQDV